MSSGAEGPSLRGARAWWGLAGVAVLVMVVVLGPVASAPARLAAGSACSEASRHLWSLAVAGQSLVGGTGLARVAEVGWPRGFSAPLIDPSSWLVFGPLHALAGPVVAWNGLVAAAVVVAAVGCGALGRALRLDAAGVGALAVGGVAAPWLLQLAETGRSEYLAAALWPLHLAALLWALDGERRWALVAAVSLGLLGAAGPPLAVFVALAELPLVVGLLAQRRGRGAGAAAGVLLGGLGLALPALLPVLTALPDKARRWGADSPGLTEPVQTSLASLVHLVPPALQPPTEQPATVALALLALALVGAWRDRGARLWLGLGLWILVLAQGTAPTAAVEVGAVRTVQTGGVVAWLVGLVPPLGAISSWSRIGCLLGLPVAVAAAHGLRGRPLWVVLPVLGLALGEQLLRPRPPAWEQHRTVVEPPAAYRSALQGVAEGPVLQLPMDLPGTGSCVARDRWLLWSLFHDRPVTAGPGENGDQGQYLGYLGAVMVRVQTGRSGPPRGGRPEVRDCLRESVAEAGASGLAAILVDTADPRGRTQAQWLSTALGPPVVGGGRFEVWEPAAAPAPEARVARCPLP